jgi:2-methylcitrate dehydratase PrpD
MNMTLTRELSALGIQTNPKDISDNAWESARILLLDALGCALAGWQADGCKDVIDQMQYWGGREEASLLVLGDKLPMPNAAFANSVLVHAQDLDDVHIPGTLHISSIVVPTMLAAAQCANTTGRDALLALIMGVEIAARIEVPGHRFRRGEGFLPSSLAGSFGGVMTAARLLGLSTEQCAEAMGINYAQLSGNRQALYDSTLSKRMQPAFAARSAIWSTVLAQRNLTGARYALEGSAGYYKLYLNMPEEPKSGQLTLPQDQWEIERVSYKRYASCGANHHCQYSAQQIHDEEKITMDQIQEVAIFGIQAGGIVSRPFEIGKNPQVDAQFSVAWSVAHSLLRGQATMKDYRSENVVADQQVIELAKKVIYIKPPVDLPEKVALPKDYAPGMVNWHGVLVTLKNGRKIMRCCAPATTFAPGNLSWDQAVAKFKQSADYSEICSASQAQLIIDNVQSLDQADDLSSLIDSLCLQPSLV